MQRLATFEVLTGLDVAELELLVFQQFPDATHLARQGLAKDVHEASGGLPAVAAPLIAAADPETLALPEQLLGASALARVTTSLSERAPEVAAAAAVLGHQFSIGALIALTELDESSIFSVLDQLWSAGLIIETDDPDQVRFRHVLIQRAFLEGVPLFRRGQLHRRAAAVQHQIRDGPRNHREQPKLPGADQHTQRGDVKAALAAAIPIVTAAGRLRRLCRCRWRFEVALGIRPLRPLQLQPTGVALLLRVLVDDEPAQPAVFHLRRDVQPDHRADQHQREPVAASHDADRVRQRDDLGPPDVPAVVT